MIQQRINELKNKGITNYDQEILLSPFLFKRFMRTRRALESSYGESINSKKDDILKNLQDSIRSLNKLKFQYNNGASLSHDGKESTLAVSSNLDTNNDDEISTLIDASNVVDEIKLDLEEMIIIRVIESEQGRCMTRTRIIPHQTGGRRGSGGGKGTRRVRWRRKRSVSRKT